MELHLVTGPPFTAECQGCHKRKVFGGDPSIPFAKANAGGFADLQGKPFVDYYCAECAAKLTRVSA